MRKKKALPAQGMSEFDSILQADPDLVSFMDEDEIAELLRSIGCIVISSRDADSYRYAGAPCPVCGQEAANAHQ